ncbi:MAG: SPOR domain-containing protein [Betaproteobacteria bacterium]|nr:SPOR domain-containing protein [Betaproteobacteria bacterium]
MRSSIRFDGNGADRRHFVQLGSLLPPANAETLRARLQEQGLPTLLETRVRVGPFVTRDEALAAEARLRELGFAADAPAAPGR